MLSKRLDSRIQEVKVHLNCQNDSPANSESTSPTYNAPHYRKVNGNSPKARVNIENTFDFKEDLFASALGKQIIR